MSLILKYSQVECALMKQSLLFVIDLLTNKGKSNNINNFIC